MELAFVADRYVDAERELAQLAEAVGLATRGRIGTETDRSRGRGDS